MIVAAGEWSSDISLRVRWGWLEVGWSFVRTLPPSLRMSMQWTLDFTALHRCYLHFILVSSRPRMAVLYHTLVL